MRVCLAFVSLLPIAAYGFLDCDHFLNMHADRYSYDRTSVKCFHVRVLVVCAFSFPTPTPHIFTLRNDEIVTIKYAVSHRSGSSVQTGYMVPIDMGDWTRLTASLSVEAFLRRVKLHHTLSDTSQQQFESDVDPHKRTRVLTTGPVDVFSVFLRSIHIPQLHQTSTMSTSPPFPMDRIMCPRSRNK